jgi:hypothetical protein
MSLCPLSMAVPFAGAQMFLVIRGQAHDTITEMRGALAPATVLANGGALTFALTFWIVPIVRAGTSILYIRACLRRLRGETSNRTVPVVAQGIGLLVMIAA